MKRFVNVISCVVAVAIGGGVTTALAADQPASQPAAQSTTKPAATQPVNPVAVKVNGQEIMESEIKEVFDTSIMSSPQAQKLKPEQIKQLRDRYRMRILNLLIDNTLIKQVADDPSGLKLSEEDYVKVARKDIEADFKKAGMSREEADKRSQERFKMSLDELIKNRAQNPLFQQYVQQTEILKTKFPEKVKVTDEEVRKFYDEHKESLYEHPEQVRASHILIKTQGLKTEEEKKKAREKIEKVKKMVNEPDADFALLARRFSDCPSGKRAGGDLDYFAREKMAKEFSDAAFALKVGEISDIVETPFGYHIIKKTGEKPASTTSFEEVKDGVRHDLEKKKMLKLHQEQLAEAKKDAKIVYPPGKEPQPVRVRHIKPSSRPAGKKATSRPASSKKVIEQPKSKDK